MELVSWLVIYLLQCESFVPKCGISISRRFSPCTLFLCEFENSSWYAFQMLFFCYVSTQLLTADIIRTVTITCTLQSVDYTDRDHHMYVTASRLYGLWQSHVRYSQSIIRTVTITYTNITVIRLYGLWQYHVQCYSQSIIRNVKITYTTVTVSRLHGPWQSHVLLIQSVDYTDRDNHIVLMLRSVDYKDRENHMY
jgi:hypothetical protein